MRLGIQLSAIPIFVFITISSFGFTYLEKDENLDLLLFDACFNYFYNSSSIDQNKLNNHSEDYSLITDKNINENITGEKYTANFFPPDSAEFPTDSLSLQKDSLNTDSINFIDDEKKYINIQDDINVLDAPKPDSNKFQSDSIELGGDTLTSDKENFIENNSENPNSSAAKNVFNLFPFDTTDIQSDSLFFGDDSLAADTVKIDPMLLDSTARLEYFRYQREDKNYVEFRQKKPSPFFAKTDRISQRVVKLDSTGNFVEIREIVAGVPQKNYLTIPLDEFINMRLEARDRDNWEQMAYKYEKKEGQDDFGKLITDITNIEIPLPSSSIFSIFGPNRINLRINGSVDIHGAWRNETTEGVTASLLGNTKNEPDFKQQVQINVSGTVGDKLSISADWNTERTFEYENQLKLKYTGYEDEIIQNIEAGNVSLQTSPLVGGSEALFGVKADFQLGPFKLTAIASQKKGETEEVSVSGGSTKQPFEIHAYDYSENHYFLDIEYANTTDPNLNLFNRFFGRPTPDVRQDKYITDLEVWKTTTGNIDQGRERQGSAFINLPAQENFSYDTFKSITIPSVQGENEINGRFVKLEEGIDYIFDEANKYTGFITFKTQINPNDAIAVAYKRQGETFGEFLNDVAADTASVIVLKLIKPKNLQPQFSQAWRLQLKNIYPIGGRDVKKEGFTLDINYQLPGQEPRNDFQGTKLLQAFKLDVVDQSGNPNPDGAFDYEPGIKIIPATGEIIFPVLQPFGAQFLDAAGLPDSIAYQSVYDTTKTFARRDNTKDRFLISGEYSASVTSVYNIGFNVVENSVRVTLGGRELAAGSDYSVDYNIGQIQIRKNEALVPGADLKITYEKNDLFSLASKTLLGFRGIYDYDKNTKLGFSYLNLNQQTLSDKVRIGEEPLNNSIMGADFKTMIELPFITKGLDNLISTSAMSSFSLAGEYAYINPDPNTKKSPIASDNGQSIAYIDDFEGAKKTIPIGVSYTSWSDISVPDSIPGLEAIFNKQSLMSYKAKTFWYNITPSDIRVQNIYGNRKQAAKDAQQITAIDFVFRPDQKGSYNYNPNVGDIRNNWGGMMKLLSASANNLIEENIEFIEFWASIIDGPDDAKIFIDLGQISEDIIPNNRLDTEDANSNDRIDQGEDTGIDGLTDEEERIQFQSTEEDPSGDNFNLLPGSLDADSYIKANGTEGNAVLTEAGRGPDSEDLNRNFSLDVINSYFRYEIPLDTNKLTNEFVKGGGAGDDPTWHLYRIPLKDFIGTHGNPSFSVIEALRLWVTGSAEEIHLRIAEFNLVGNQWQKVLTKTVTEDDTTLILSTINYEDNPDYEKPADVIRERDRSKPDEEVFENEQSLQLIINDLQEGDRREAVKFLIRPLDLFNYRELKMYLHGDKDTSPGSVSYQEDGVPKGGEVYLRFGSDTTNYYEYRRPIEPGWENLSVIFEELTAFKQLASDSSKYFPVSGREGHFYGVKGNPTLTRVSFFLIGIENPADSSGSISGEIWANELRVLGADNAKGWAYSANTSIKLADLLSVGFNISQRDPNFHKLNERFGTRVDAKNWGMNVDFNILKLIPLNLSGSNLNISYQRTESISKPIYQPGTDVRIDAAAKQEEAKLIDEGLSPEEASYEANKLIQDSYTLSTSETWAASNVKIRIPTDAWYINETINNLTFGFNYNKKYGRNPTTSLQNGWIWNASVNYNLNLGRENYFRPIDIPYLGDALEIFSDYKGLRINYLPQTFTASVSAKRNWNYSLTRTTDVPSIQRDFTTVRNAGFSWQLTEGGIFNWAIGYSTSITSSLAYLLTIENPDANFDFDRPEGEIWNDIFSSAGFGKPFDFAQSFDIKTSPILPSIWDINKYVRVTAGYSVTYNWKNNFQQEDLGRGAGYSNRFNAGLNFRLKSLFRPWFEDLEATAAAKTPNMGRGARRGQNPQIEEGAADSLEFAADSLDEGISTFDATMGLLKTIANIIFFDYEQISFNFSQNNSFASSGLKGLGTGLTNFWGINQREENGPNRLFMLGLSNNAGPRAPNGTLSDNFSQKNNLDFKTQKPLWEGATIDLSWNLGWGMNKSTTLTTDSLGNITINNINSTGTIDRSFLSLPNTLVFSMFGNGIKKVNELYDSESSNPSQSLSDAFIEGFETLPLLEKIPILADVAKYIPRPNWQINWSGLEKMGFFKDVVSRASISHGYSSTYSEGWKIIPESGVQEIQTQRIMYGFNPLIGLNLTFNKIFDGNLTSSLKFSTRTSYSLGSSTRNITENYSKEISFTTSFSKSGFELPMFGLSLKNDIEVSLSYTSSQNSIVIFEMDKFRDEGTPQDGTIRTTIEPRIKYIMSSRVTLSLFYKRSQVEIEGVSKIPPTTTNEAGLDVHISIN
ncbi:MAG: cell surface protein SprA [Bacteroidetes bacterium]|nr:cell surface protein SprA [Bacteroidota bacterium]